MFNQMITTLKTQNRKIVFTEGTDPRILEAASRLHTEGILTPILLGTPTE
ncbi:phosphate acyltransferase, partial [Clostridium perfringens]|nr:phosphate acyltransferase [Clostridium perfringens]